MAIFQVNWVSQTSLELCIKMLEVRDCASNFVHYAQIMHTVFMLIRLFEKKTVKFYYYCFLAAHSEQLCLWISIRHTDFAQILNCEGQFTV